MGAASMACDADAGHAASSKRHNKPSPHAKRLTPRRRKHKFRVATGVYMLDALRVHAFRRCRNRKKDTKKAVVNWTPMLVRFRFPEVGSRPGARQRLVGERLGFWRTRLSEAVLDNEA